MAGLVLGGVAFSGFEIPNQINFGGKHNVVVHELIGGNRVLDSMGSKPEQIAWNGRFRGANAIARAQAIDEMRISGAQVDLAWLNLFRSVVVVHFKANTEKINEVSYDIACEVVNEAGALLGGLFQSIDTLINNDLAAIAGITASPVASTTLATLQTALAAIGAVTGATSANRTAASSSANTAMVALKNAFADEEQTLNQTMPTGMPMDIADWLSAQNSNVAIHGGTIDALAYVTRIGINMGLVKT